MLAFNFFFLPPVYTFTLADRSNWLALAVYVVDAIVVGSSRRGTGAAERRGRAAGARGRSARRHRGRPSPRRPARGRARQIEERTATVLGVSSVRSCSATVRAPPRASSPHPLDRRGPHDRRAVHARERGADARDAAPPPPGARVARSALRSSARRSTREALEADNAAPERHGQDSRDPGGLARPSDSARDDRAGARRPGERRARADRRRPSRTPRDDPRRARPAQAPRREPPRPLPPPGAGGRGDTRSSGRSRSWSPRRSTSCRSRSVSSSPRPTSFRRCASTPPRSSARSRTCSRTRCASRLPTSP